MNAGNFVVVVVVVVIAFFVCFSFYRLNLKRS